jgi:2-polyprenyl-6-methoxyphenol hydroxylase-like FAD-dependent oxidoreductase
MTTDVVIAGGGPNGLLMACELALAGVRPVLLERLPERATEPKANGLVGRVVQALDYRGLYGRFTGRAAPPVPVPGFQFGALPLDLSALAGHALYALPIPQRRMEELLEQRARELGAEIRRGHELTAVSQAADLVTIGVQGPDGHYELTAKFLVGADGGHSIVRKGCGISFPGVTDRGFVARSGQVTIHPPVAVPGTGELDVPGAGRLRPATFTRTENGMFTYGMFQPGLYRVAVYEWAPPPPEDGPARPLEDAAAMPLEELRAAVRRVVGGDVPMSEPEGGEPAALRRSAGANSRQAERYRHGRVFLAGDAAHVHSGVGGPGLNLGLQDVLNLGWKLAAAVSGWAPDRLLDTYQSERHPVGQRVIMQTRAQAALLSPGPNVTALRDLFGELLREPAVVAHIADLMAGADVRYDTRSDGPAHPMAGKWMPDIGLRTGSGRTRIAELLRPGRAILLGLPAPASLLGVARGWSDRVDVIGATTSEPPADAILIRPDGYVAWAGGGGEPGAADGLRHALRTWFGEPAGVVNSDGAASEPALALADRGQPPLR